MAEFLHAFKTILANEGGYVNDPNDAGGETYAGIARKFNPAWEGWTLVDKSKPLKKGDRIPGEQMESFVRTFYKATQWDAVKGDLINDQWVAEFIVDWFVTSGATAVKKLQSILGFTGTDVDGKLGKGTLSALNAFDQDKLKDALIKSRIAFYNAIVANKPDQAKFLKGWLNRVEQFRNKI